MKKTILIVEDEEAQSQVLRDFLNNKGYNTLQAADGREGLKTALQSHPDAILLDVRMPKMSGMEMMKKLREDPWGAKVPIVILSNYDVSDNDIARIIYDKPAFYLVKSNSSLDDVLEKIQEVLS